MTLILKLFDSIDQNLSDFSKDCSYGFESITIFGQNKSLPTFLVKSAPSISAKQINLVLILLYTCTLSSDRDISQKYNHKTIA